MVNGDDRDSPKGISNKALGNAQGIDREDARSPARAV